MSGDVYRLSDTEVVEPRVTQPIFAAMINGLAAGVVAAAAIVVAIAVVISFPSGSIASGLFAALIGSTLVLTTASALAIFPIGPLWLMMAWILVRHDTRSVWVYAAAGSAAATGMPVLLPIWIFIVATGTINAGLSGFLGWLVFFAWFAVSGAIGGAFAGARVRDLLGAREPRDGSSRGLTSPSLPEKLAS